MLDFTIKDASNPKYSNIIELQVYINSGTIHYADLFLKKFSNIENAINEYGLSHMGRAVGAGIHQVIYTKINTKQDIILLDNDDLFFNSDLGGKYENLPSCSDEDYARLLKSCFMYVIEHYSPSSLGFLVRSSSLRDGYLEKFLVSEGFLTPKHLGQNLKHKMYGKQNTFDKQLFILQN